MAEKMTNPAESRPDPDPTTLTTEQLDRAIGGLKEVLEARMTGNEKTISLSFEALTERFRISEATFNARIIESETSRNEALNKAAKTIQDGLDKAERLLQQALDRAQQELRSSLVEAEKRVNEKFDTKDRGIDEKVTHLQSLHAERFTSIETQFAERDKRAEQLSLADSTRVNAALAAQEKQAIAQNESNAAANAKSEAGFTKQIDAIAVLINTSVNGLNDKIEDIKARINGTEGRSKGMDAGWGYLVGGVTLIATIIGAVFLIISRSGQ